MVEMSLCGRMAPCVQNGPHEKCASHINHIITTPIFSPRMPSKCIDNGFGKDLAKKFAMGLSLFNLVPSVKNGVFARDNPATVGGHES